MMESHQHIASDVIRHLERFESGRAKPTFGDELRALINRHSVENESNTPDWILAKLLLRTLDAYAEAVFERDGFNGNGATGSE